MFSQRDSILEQGSGGESEKNVLFFFRALRVSEKGTHYIGFSICLLRMAVASKCDHIQYSPIVPLPESQEKGSCSDLLALPSEK